MHTDQTWLIVLSDLSSKGRVAKKDYQSWLERTKLLGFDREAGTATVGAPDTFTVETLAKRYRETVAESLSAVLRQPVTVEFVVLNSTGAAASAAPAPAPANSHAGRRESVNVRPARNATSNPPRSPLPGSPPPALQLELGAGSDGLNPRYVFDTFIVGPSNRLAHAASLAVADNPGGDYNPLFIYGGVGLGKTHLMHAIGHRAKDQFGPDLRILYLTSEQFTNDMVASIRSGKMEDFRDRYRTNDILMIDDIQFIGGKDSTEEEFFHTFNHLYQAGKHIILTSDRLPKAIPTLNDRLRTRFEMGLTVDVQPPDLETRIAILQQKGEASGMYVPRDVLDYVAQKVQSNIRELEGTLTRIIAHARLEGVAITLPLATAAMNDPQMNTRRKLITLPRIIETVARFYQVPEKDLIGKRRTKDIVIPRQVAMYIMREETDRSLVDIGEALGGKDHSTVMHGIDKTSGEIERNADRRQEVLAIREMLYADGPS
jgi:chromosomal replication initiator protein